MRIGFLAAAVGVLGFAWLGPLPDLARHSFTAHMTMHMAVVAVAAPLVALSIGGSNVDPVRGMPQVMAPIPASLIELVVVWLWHVPALHEAARQQQAAFALEQASFVAAGLLLWIAALGGDREQLRLRAGGGIVALLFTSMHMTLLGALFALTNRPLFQHGPSPAGLAAVADQHLGGVIMLLVGGVSYLAGGLWLTSVVLRRATVSAVREQEPSV